MARTQNFAILHIGSSDLDVIVARKGIADTLVLSGEGKADYAGYDGGAVVEPQNLADALRQAIHLAESETQEPITMLYVGVPTDFCRVTTVEASLSFPRPRKVRQSDVNDLFALAAKKVQAEDLLLINRAPIYFIADGDRRISEVVGEKVTKLGIKASFVFAEREFVATMNAVLGEVGVGNVRYLCTALAEMHYLFTDAERAKPLLLVDVAEGNTTVAVGQGNGLLSIASFASGGGFFDADLSLCFHISYDEAVRLRKKVVLSLDVGLDDKYYVEYQARKRGYPALDVNTIVADRVIEMADLVSHCLDVNRALIAETDEIYLTGSGLFGFHGGKDCFAKALNRTVKAVAPKQPLLDKPSMSEALSLVNLAMEIDGE